MLCCAPSTVEAGEFLLVTADEQTEGRGQRGTTWESTRGENLTFNIGWKGPFAPLHLPPPGGELEASAFPIAREPLQAGGGLEGAGRPHWPAANEQFLISEITALAVLRAIDDTFSDATIPAPIDGGRVVAIKWPNDVYVGDRKICGMLLEHQLSGRHIAESIAGIGINVNQSEFTTEAGKAEGRGAPISLRQIVGHEVEREAVLECFVGHFMEGVRMLQDGRYDEVERDFMAHLYRRMGLHPYRDADGDFMGELVSVARNGTLNLRKSDGTVRSYAFKEVAYII